MRLLYDAFTFGSHTVVLVLSCVILTLQGVILAAMFFKTNRAHRERELLYRELFALMQKIESMSAGKRGMVLHQFDNLLDSLVKQMPSRIAVEAGERIFETESQFLKTLSELEPGLISDPSSQRRIEQLVQSMENLEATVVSLTCESIRQAMLDVRQSLLAQDAASG